MLEPVESVSSPNAPAIVEPAIASTPPSATETTASNDLAPEIVPTSLHESDTNASVAAEPAETALFELAFDQALQTALTNNLRLQVLALAPEEAKAWIPQEQSRFDPVFGSGGRYSSVNQQVQSAIQAFGTGLDRYQGSAFAAAGGLSDQLQLEKQWQTGTRARLGYSTLYDQSDSGGRFLVVNPAWRSGINLTLEQPLGQGFGRRPNVLGIEVAQARLRQTAHEFQAEVNRILHETAVAYWRLHLEQSYVDSLKQILGAARLTAQRERKQLEIGQASVVDVAQADEELAALEADLEAASQRVRTATRNLQRVLGLSAADDLVIRLTAEPTQQPFEPHLEHGLQQALDSRPELIAARQALQAAQLQLEQNRDQMKPQVVATAGYGLSGLNNGLTGSLNQLSSLEFGDWSLGLSYRRSLGQRAERSAVQRAELSLRRQRLNLQDQAQQIEHEVRDTHQTIQSAYAVMLRQSERLRAAQARFDTSQRMYQTGQLDLDRFLRSLRGLVVATRSHREAVVEFNLSRNRWYWVTSTLTVSPHAGEPPSAIDPLSSPDSITSAAVELERQPQ